MRLVSPGHGEPVASSLVIRRFRIPIIAALCLCFAATSCANISSPDLSVDGVEYSRSELNEVIEGVSQSPQLEGFAAQLGIDPQDTSRWVQGPAMPLFQGAGANDILTLVIYREILAKEIRRTGGEITTANASWASLTSALSNDFQTVSQQFASTDELLAWIDCRVGSQACADPTIPAAEITLDPRYGTWEPDALPINPNSPVSGAVQPPAGPQVASVG